MEFDSGKTSGPLDTPPSWPSWYMGSVRAQAVDKSFTCKTGVNPRRIVPVRTLTAYKWKVKIYSCPFLNQKCQILHSASKLPGIVHSPEEVASGLRILCWVTFFHYLSLASLNGLVIRKERYPLKC